MKLKTIATELRNKDNMKNRKISILGKTLKDYRKRKGLTAAALAATIGISRIRIMQIENGQATGVWDKTLTKILNILELTPKEYKTLSGLIAVIRAGSTLKEAIDVKLATQAPSESLIMLGSIRAVIKKDTYRPKRKAKIKKV